MSSNDQDPQDRQNRLETAPLADRRRGPRALRPIAEAGDGTSAVDLDRLIHERLRLGLVSALATSETLTFVELKARLRTTDGNLSVHAKKLEQAGYVSCTKGFDGRMPRSEYRLTHAGRKALERYLDQMDAIIKTTRGATT